MEFSDLTFRVAVAGPRCRVGASAGEPRWSGRGAWPAGDVADLVAAGLALPVPETQAIRETLDVTDRLDRVAAARGPVGERTTRAGVATGLARTPARRRRAVRGAGQGHADPHRAPGRRHEGVGVGMTGEITLRGTLLPVGGVREKVLAARRAGPLAVVRPRRNEPGRT